MGLKVDNLYKKNLKKLIIKKKYHRHITVLSKAAVEEKHEITTYRHQYVFFQLYLISYDRADKL